jgi:hypothetical protein
MDEAIYNYETGKDWNIKTRLGKSKIRITITYPDNVVLTGKKQISLCFYLSDKISSSSIEYNGVNKTLTGSVFTETPLIALSRVKQIQKALKNKFGKRLFVNVPIYDLNKCNSLYGYIGSTNALPVYRVKQGKRKEA